MYEDASRVLPARQAIKEDTFGRLPLHYSAALGELAAISSLLDGEGARKSIFHEDIWGWTPLHYAAFFGHYECVKSLVKMGRASVGRCDGLGRTPLHLAAIGGSKRVYRFLVDSDADVLGKDVFANAAGVYLDWQEEHDSRVDDRDWMTTTSRPLIVIMHYSDAFGGHASFVLWEDGVVMFAPQDYRDRAMQMLMPMTAHDRIEAVRRRTHLRAQMRIGRMPEERALLIGHEINDVVSGMRKVEYPFDAAYVRIDCQGASMVVEERLFDVLDLSQQGMERSAQVECLRIAALIEMRLPLRWLPAAEFLDGPRFRGFL